MADTRLLLKDKGITQEQNDEVHERMVAGSMATELFDLMRPWKTPTFDEYTTYKPKEVK